MGKALVVFLLISMMTVSMSGCLTEGGDGYGIHVYTRSDACGAAQTWAEYLGDYSQEDLKGTGVYGDPGIAEAVKKDDLGIGYNNLNYAYDMESGRPVQGLRVLPIDINENGKIDAEEDFYDTKTQLVEAIGDGRYPSPPARDLNLVTKDKFTGTTQEFARWILTEGQKYIDEVGYIVLPEEKITEQLAKLGDPSAETELKGTITVSGAWALYPMMVRWSEEFKKEHPNVEFNISAGGAGKGVADALGRMVDLGMVSRGIYPAEIEKGACWVSVTKDAVVPVMNENNPLLEDLLAKGVKRDAFADLWITEGIIGWKDLVSE